MRSLFIAFCFASATANAQVVTLDQSSASSDWSAIENEFVEVIYPAERKEDAIYIANLIEHYSKIVGQSYQIDKPKKVSLVLRSEMSQPNGFVTLAPRRTEWFSSSTYSPITTSLDWYQILSIHEYRHVQQNDAFVTGSVTYLDYLFGDLGQAIAGAFAKKSWMAEGDAVWAETHYTDGGRGRSPRFPSRLKALLLAGKTPSYDQFVNGTYNDLLVNQYVYGYFLIANGYKKFGNDFWSKVSDEGALFPHPFRFPSAFFNVSGMTFNDFYDETFADLRKQWKSDSFKDLKKTDYNEESDPAVVDGQLYYIHYDLDSFHALYQRGEGKDKKIAEFPFNRELAPTDFSKDYAVYAEMDPDWRYGFVGESDLKLIDLKSGQLKTITNGKRLYNPHFNAAGDKIVATEFKQDGAWQLTLLTLDGAEVDKVWIPKLKLMEGNFLDPNTLVAIANDNEGKKSLIKIKLSDKSYETLIAPSRNSLFALASDGKSRVLFEAQDKGSTNIFLLSTDSKSLSRCSRSIIGSYSPGFAGDKDLVYSEETPYGTRIAQKRLSECTPAAISELLDYNYLSDTPSDNYTKSQPVAFHDLGSLHQKNEAQYEPRKYGMFEKRAFIPHTWNFFAGRGLGLMLKGDNFLGDFGYTLSLGQSGEENQPYSNLQLDFKRYPLIVSVVADISDREYETLFQPSETRWEERSFGLKLTLPYVFSNALFNGDSLLTYDARQLTTKDYEFNDADSDLSGGFFKSELAWTFSYLKQRKFRSILPPWGTNWTLGYSSAVGTKDELDTSSRIFGVWNILTPGAFANDGFRFELSGEQYTQEGIYRFYAPQTDPLGYAFSRGYTYEAAERFEKASGNYVFPIAYPDYSLGHFWYLKRNSINLFADYSKAFTNGEHREMNSFGSELMFESVFFQLLPVNIGFRYMRLVSDKEEKFEVFTTTTLSVF